MSAAPKGHKRITAVKHLQFADIPDCCTSEAMSDSTERLSLHMTVYISPENVEKFWEAFKPLYDHVIAEPECTFFEVYQSAEDPGTISWVENW